MSSIGKGSGLFHAEEVVGYWPRMIRISTIRIAHLNCFGLDYYSNALIFVSWCRSFKITGDCMLHSNTFVCDFLSKSEIIWPLNFNPLEKVRV